MLSSSVHSCLGRLLSCFVIFAHFPLPHRLYTVRRFHGDYGLGCVTTQNIPRLTELGEEVAEKVAFGNSPGMPETAEQANMTLAVRYLRNPLCAPHIALLHVDQSYEESEPEG